MPKWTSLQRRTKLLDLLQRGQPVVASRLADMFECNELTVRRQLESLHTKDQLPVHHDRVTELAGMPISVDNRMALLLSLQAATQL